MRKVSVLSLSLTLLVGLNFAFAGGETIDLGGLKSTAPASWKGQTPSNRLRLYQMSIPRADGDKEDADLAIFKDFGGTTEENIARWKKQFIAPQGKTLDETSKLEKYKVGKAEVICLDISGTYKYKFPPQDPNAKEKLKENFRRFNVIIYTDKNSYFITLTGPAKTMQKNKEAFDSWIKAFK